MQSQPDFEASHSLGLQGKAAGDFDGARRHLARAVSLDPHSGPAHANLSSVCLSLGRYHEALDHGQIAARLAPGLPEVWHICGSAFHALNQIEQALSCYDQAIALRPGYAAVRRWRGLALALGKRLEEALADFEAAFAAGFIDGVAACSFLHLRMHRARWGEFDALRALAIGNIAGLSGCPLGALAIVDDPARHLAMAKAYSAAFPAAPPLRKARNADRLVIAYVSADFRAHATTTLITPFIEAHDRERFKVIGISHGEDDGSDERRRICAAFDDMLDARAMSDAEVAAWMRGQGVDIAIDLKGHTEGARPGILAARAAPVQVAAVAYPGTTGAPWIDAIIGDAVVIAAGEEQLYSERVVRMPHCYLPVDPNLAVGPRPSRAEAGLPEQGVVLCSFNNTWKITPEAFDIWAGLLRETEGSVLWLLATSEEAQENLRREARQRGVSPERIVFAPRADPAAHLARLAMADLCLDTWPYGGHTTSYDALIVGVPVLTWSGKTFASRVASSMLKVLDIPELIAESPQDYAARGVGLARNPERLAGIRKRIEAARAASPLFDPAGYARDLEALFERLAREAI